MNQTTEQTGLETREGAGTWTWIGMTNVMEEMEWDPDGSGWLDTKMERMPIFLKEYPAMTARVYRGFDATLPPMGFGYR